MRYSFLGLKAALFDFFKGCIIFFIIYFE